MQQNHIARKMMSGCLVTVARMSLLDTGPELSQSRSVSLVKRTALPAQALTMLSASQKAMLPKRGVLVAEGYRIG